LISIYAKIQGGDFERINVESVKPDLKSQENIEDENQENEKEYLYQQK
jgi:hypothetical protein